MGSRYFSTLSLRVKCAAFSSAIILVLSMGLTWVFVSQTNRWLLQNFEQRGFSQIEELAADVAPALRDQDRDGIRQIVSGSFVEAEVAYVGVMDSQGKVLEDRLRQTRFYEISPSVLQTVQRAEGPALIATADRYGQPTYFFFTPVMDGEVPAQRRLGALVLGISSHFLQRDIHEVVRLTLPISIGALVVSCLIVIFLIERSLRPLGDMVRLTSRIAAGDFSQRVKVDQQDEIGKLAKSFDAMAESLEEREEKRRQAEEALRQKAGELARSNTELQQFAYIASHDLQEPLRMVASYVQLLARRYKGKLDTDADEFIAFALDGVLRMRGLIHALLAYSRLGMKGKEFEPTDCEVVLKHTLADLWAAMEESGAVVTHDPLPTVVGDATQLGQLFQNLIGNAIKYRGTEAPRIHVASQRNGKEWLFSVRDNGIGIDPQYAERIFVIFQRLHSREEYPGTGVGLTLCKKIVERHGGRIWVESRPGEGSTFCFAIPTAITNKGDKEGGRTWRP